MAALRGNTGRRSAALSVSVSKPDGDDGLVTLTATAGYCGGPKRPVSGRPEYLGFREEPGWVPPVGQISRGDPPSGRAAAVPPHASNAINLKPIGGERWFPAPDEKFCL